MATEKIVITNRNRFEELAGLLDVCKEQNVRLSDNMTYDDLQEFITKQIANLDKKAADAAKRAAEKKANGDELRQQVYDLLNPDEYMSITEVHEAMGNPEDISVHMITARLSQLEKAGYAEKEKKTVEVNGKNKSVSAYRKIIVEE